MFSYLDLKFISNKGGQFSGRGAGILLQRQMGVGPTVDKALRMRGVDVITRDARIMRSASYNGNA